MACIRMAPIVNGLEQHMAGRLEVIRVDIQTNLGRSMAPDYGVIGTPTFILFDPSGEIILKQVGFIDPEKVQQLLLP